MLKLDFGFSFSASVKLEDIFKVFFDSSGFFPGSFGISLVPLVLGLSKLEGLLIGSATYLPFTLHEVCSDRPTVSSALSIGADPK